MSKNFVNSKKLFNNRESVSIEIINLKMLSKYDWVKSLPWGHTLFPLV